MYNNYNMYNIKCRDFKKRFVQRMTKTFLKRKSFCFSLNLILWARTF